MFFDDVVDCLVGGRPVTNVEYRQAHLCTDHRKLVTTRLQGANMPAAQHHPGARCGQALGHAKTQAT